MEYNKDGKGGFCGQETTCPPCSVWLGHGAEYGEFVMRLVGFHQMLRNLQCMLQSWASFCRYLGTEHRPTYEYVFNKSFLKAEVKLTCTEMPRSQGFISRSFDKCETCVTNTLIKKNISITSESPLVSCFNLHSLQATTILVSTQKITFGYS